MGPLDPGSFVDLSDRAKLRLTGADRVRYLNGQISNDVRKATDALAIHACVLTAKGKINADIFIRSDGGSLLIDSDSELREQLSARLERYIIADDVQIEDVTEEFALLHVLGAEVPALSMAHAVSRADRFGASGADVWLQAGDRGAALRELSSALTFCDADVAENLRIERGLPRWGRELTEEIIPAEANLESAVIDYAKGCYIGQEVISRIKMSGQTNKRLCGLVCAGEVPLAAGMRLLTPDEGKDVGWITSVAESPRCGRQIALGYVKRGAQSTGNRLEARGGDGPGTAAEIVPLPFV